MPVFRSLAGDGGDTAKRTRKTAQAWAPSLPGAEGSPSLRGSPRSLGAPLCGVPPQCVSETSTPEGLSDAEGCSGAPTPHHVIQLQDTSVGTWADGLLHPPLTHTEAKPLPRGWYLRGLWSSQTDTSFDRCAEDRGPELPLRQSRTHHGPASAPHSWM